MASNWWNFSDARIYACATACLAIACQGCNIAKIVLSLQGHLFRAAFLRHVPLFIRNLSENVVLCLAAAAVESTAKTMLAHMELRWRNSLTSRMHTPYFENMVSACFSHTKTCLLLTHQNTCSIAWSCCGRASCSGARPIDELDATQHNVNVLQVSTGVHCFLGANGTCISTRDMQCLMLSMPG